jgi:hypothetical protein
MWLKMFANSAAAARRTGAVVALCGLGLMVSATAAFAAPAVVEQQPTVTGPVTPNGCNGVLPTPGSENTDKVLVGGDMMPGGTAEFEISYPVDAGDVGEDFSITDCVYVDSDPTDAVPPVALAKYFIDFVPNNTAYKLTYTVDIPAGTAIGADFCNYAKTTGSPSTSSASNRKAGPACFNVGGSLRVEKRAGSATGDLLPGATFEVDCDADAAVPPVVVSGLDEDGVATTGEIAINGPEGTVCEVTETAAPDGYELAEDASHTLTIPRGDTASVDVFVNTETTGEGCPEGMVDDGEGGCVTPTVEPTEEPSEEPTEEPTEDPTDGPTVEPTDPAPSISPTVKGVKIVKPPTAPTTLPNTGAYTGLLLALGLGLTVVGGALVLQAGRPRRQH